MPPVAGFVLIALFIALIGGGWLPLRRVDPLLAVPGLGWASLALVIRPIPVSAGRLAAMAALALSLCLAGLAAALSGQWPILQLVLAAACATLIAWSALALSHLLRRAIARSSVRRAALMAGGLTLGLGMQVAGWAVLPLLYQAPDRQRELNGDSTARKPATRLVTALPLVTLDDPRFLVGDRAEPSSILMAWDRVNALYRVDRASDAELRRTTSLILAHPAAMLPEDLVAVDSFVRRGGAVLIFADGLLSWPSAFPVGDSRNPPVTSLLSPLLDHWGVTLDAPAGLRQEPVDILDGLMRLALFSPGRLRVAADSPCRVGLDGLVANCRIGRGRVSIIADADMLNDTLWLPTGRSSGAGATARSRADNARWVSGKLAETAGFVEPEAWAEPVWVR